MADTEQNEPTLNALMREAAALDTAIAQAQGQLNEMTAAASEADRLAAAQGGWNCTIHEVPGIGRYAIPTQPGWKALIDVVHDKSVDINYSPNLYPVFDGVIQEVTQSPYLDNPDEPKYDSATFRHLRDNIAAVRNFLMQTYYADNSSGLSGGDAKRALTEIATFVGEGLDNNLRFAGLIPNHDPTKPFIALDEASQPHGAGAQYIYEEILKQQRHSNWWRPFAQITSLFGGQKPVDWQLPAASATPFVYGALENAALGHQAEEAIAQRLQQMQQERDALVHAMEHTAAAVDLETIGNQMLATADRLNDVTQLSEPVRRDAIERAKEILRGLKIQFGDRKLLDGICLRSSNECQGLGEMLGAAHIYERVLAWGRGIDPSIAQHPSIMAATQAVGQLGYLSKLEAMRVANSVGNVILADRVAVRIAGLPEVYKNVSARNYSEMYDRIEGGINTVLDRIQAIQGPGAGVGHTPYKDLGSYMSAAPIAGLAMQLTGDGANRDSVGKRNMEVMAAEDAAMQAQANRIQSQNAERARQQGQQSQQQQRPARGQQAVQQAQQQQRRQGSPVQANVNALNAAQRQALLQRNAALRSAQDHPDHHHDPAHIQKVNPTAVNPLLANPAMAKIKADLARSGVNTNDLVTGKAAFNKMQSAAVQGLKPSAVPNVKNMQPQKPRELSETEKKRQQQIEAVAPGAPKGTGGHGR